MSQPISFRWSPELVERIDTARGDVPRSRWVRRAVEDALDAGGRPGIGAPQELGAVPRSSLRHRFNPQPKGKR